MRKWKFLILKKEFRQICQYYRKSSLVHFRTLGNDLFPTWSKCQQMLICWIWVLVLNRCYKVLRTFWSLIHSYRSWDQITLIFGSLRNCPLLAMFFRFWPLHTKKSARGWNLLSDLHICPTHPDDSTCHQL